MAATSKWVDFQLVNGLVVIPTEIHGIEGYSAIDTGSVLTGIEHSFVEKHKANFLRDGVANIQGVHGREKRAAYRDLPVKLLGVEIVFKKVVDLNLDPRGQLLIGGDFLRGLYFQFDYPNKRLRAISRDTFDLKKISNVKTRLDPVTRQPIARVSLNDEHDTWLTIDTGNSGGVVMKRGPAKKNKWLEKYTTEERSSRGATSSSTVEEFRLPVIGIGPFNVRNARIAVPPEGKQLDMFRQNRSRLGTRSKSQGLLGYDVLKNFIITFDYQTGAMFIELPKAQPAE